ncbi:uncharacterized protein LOC123300623 [Chrysoperla carnea]|uniref:uncharacterized protein LOC123300623 n=1 Tax=Chrysoperla carnea TaxID=189513 RepID=UPI001D07446C|nr:uncharacterized protein LOC123300623 [Chrysoperla carnea]
MKLIFIIFIIFIICTLNLIYAKVPSGYVDPSNIKKYERGRYSSYRQQEDQENCLEMQRIDCECDNKDCKHYEDDVLNLHAYHKRLVNSLINSLQVNGDKYVLKLNTEIMEEQLQILKDYGKSKELNYDTLRQVDDLISDILYEAQSASIYDNINENWTHYLKLFSTTQNIIIIAVTAVVYMTYRLIHIQFSILRAIGLFMFVFLIIGFGWTWHDLVEEEEIKLMSERMQYPIPPECNAAEMTWFQRWFSSKTSVDCLKFVRAHNKRASLSITPQKVFSEMFGQSISHLLGHFINTMVEFITKMHESLPFPFNYLSLPFLLLFVLLMIVLMVIILSGTRLRLSILHIFNMELGNSSRRRDGDRDHREYLQQIPQQALLEQKNVDAGADMQIQNQRLPLEGNANVQIQRPVRIEPINFDDGDNIQTQHESPKLEVNFNGIQVKRLEIELRKPDHDEHAERVEIKDNKTDNKHDDCGTSLTKTENIACQTELINSTSQSQITNINYEINKVENIFCKDDDKSHGDDSLTNSFDLKETSNNKLEVGNGDTP